MKRSWTTECHRRMSVIGGSYWIAHNENGSELTSSKVMPPTHWEANWSIETIRDFAPKQTHTWNSYECHRRLQEKRETWREVKIIIFHVLLMIWNLSKANTHSPNASISLIVWFKIRAVFVLAALESCSPWRAGLLNQQNLNQINQWFEEHSWRVLEPSTEYQFASSTGWRLRWTRRRPALGLDFLGNY